MNLRLLGCVVTLMIGAGLAQASSASGQATVRGRVTDNRGMPVAGASVTVFPFAAFKGSLPTVVSSADGSFVLSFPAFGQGVVSAYKSSAGFPDAEMALYGKWAYPSVAKIDAEPGSSIRVELRFGDPEAVIRWRILSNRDRQPISDAYFKIAWSDNPSVMASFSLAAGTVEFVLPRHPIVITITARGYKDWTSSTVPDLWGSSLLKPGSVDERTILLDPVGK